MAEFALNQVGSSEQTHSVSRVSTHRRARGYDAMVAEFVHSYYSCFFPLLHYLYYTTIYNTIDGGLKIWRPANPNYWWRESCGMSGTHSIQHRVGSNYQIPYSNQLTTRHENTYTGMMFTASKHSQTRTNSGLRIAHRVGLRCAAFAAAPIGQARLQSEVNPCCAPSINVLRMITVCSNDTSTPAASGSNE